MPIDAGAGGGPGRDRRQGRRKVALIALDSITPVMLDRFIAEGRMPNIEKMRRRGWWSEVFPTWPPTTPAGWTTVATGAWPSTHGIEGFAVHVEGEPLDKKNHACLSDRVKAEFLWEAAERAGKDSILLKYPLSWPPRGGDRVLQVDGAGGWGGLKCLFDLVHSGCWDTHLRPAESGSGAAEVAQEWVTRDSDNLGDEAVQLLPVRDPEEGGWRNLEPGLTPLWETKMDLCHRGASGQATVHILAVRAETAEAAPGGSRSAACRVILSVSRDGARATEAGPGGWSGWLEVEVPAPGGPVRGHLRVKVLAFEPEARRLRLYQGQIHQAAGFTRPPSLAGELLAAAGPFVEWTEGYERLQGWIDDATQLEIYQDHVAWMSRATAHLLENHPWDLYMTEVHFLDMAYHLYWGAVDPEHPQHDPARAAFYWDFLGKVHELADRFVGAVREAAGDDALLVVMGDHGHDLYHTSFLANHLLLREGLLSVYQDRRTGSPRIDWTKSRAYASSYRVYLNVAGRDPQGVVPPGEYRAVQERVIQAFQAVADPRTGQHPVRLAVRREDALALGLGGGSMGDVVFAMAPGFQTRSTISLDRAAWVAGRARPEAVPILKPTDLWREFTGEHDTSLPLTRAIRTLVYLDGPGVAAGGPKVPIRMVDVAPTISRYLDLPFPAGNEGNPIVGVFDQTD